MVSKDQADNISRMIQRLHLCRDEIKRSKQALIFWSNELRMVSEVICDQTQLKFEEILKEGVL